MKAEPKSKNLSKVIKFDVSRSGTHSWVKQQDKRKMMVSESGTIHILKVKDLLCILTTPGYTNIVMRSGKNIITSMSLKQINRKLPEGEFARIHQSAIVQLDDVVEVRRTTVVLSDRRELDCSRRMRPLLIAALEKRVHAK